MSTLRITLVLLAATPVWADDSTPSGPRVGDKLPSFKALAVSGDDAGKEITLPVGEAKGPTLLIFVHHFDRPGFRCLRPIDVYAGQLAEHKLAAHIIWLTDDKDQTKDYLERAKNSLNLRSTVGIAVDGKKGPANYGLSDRVTFTILLAREGKVVSNFGLVGANDTDAPRVLAAMAKFLGKKAPTVKELLQP